MLRVHIANGRTNLMDRTDLSTADPALSPSAQRRKERREKRQERGENLGQNWRSFVPGANEPVSTEPPALTAATYELPPPARGPPLSRFLRKREVLALTSLSNSELYALAAADRFPKPFKLTGTTGLSERGGAVAWDATEVAAWMNSRRATRNSD
jgi:prophage regulatory protein